VIPSVLTLLAFVLNQTQPEGVTRGDALKRREYQTYAPVTLFVDPTGSDTNACTASGAAACATLTGALAKLPKNLRHNVTINVATGTYTDLAALTGFKFESTTATATSFTVLGMQVTFTPATGTGTGTITAFVDQPDTVTTRGVLTDGTQSWTTDDLRGRFLEITSGAASGQVRPIAENTATTITFVGAFATDPVIGDSYRISTPGPVWTSNGLNQIRGNSGFGSIRVESLQQQAMTIGDNTLSSIQIAGMRVIGTTSAVSVQTSRLTLSSTPPNFIEGGTGPGLNILPVATSTWAQVTVGTSLIRTNATTVGALNSAGGAVAIIFGSGTTAYFQAPNATTTASGVVSVQGTDVLFPPNTRSGLIVDCGGVANSVGLGGLGQTNSVLHRRARVEMTYSLFLNCTTAVRVTNGYSVNVQQPGYFLTYSGVTNEWLIDGAPYTQAFIQSLSPALVATPRGTTVTYALP
jgi:hypothetical protein